MYLKYKDFIGELVYYEKLTDGSNRISITLEQSDGKALSGFCKESDITIPNVMGNSRILFELNKQQQKQKGEKNEKIQ